MNKISKIIWSLFSGVLCMVYKSDANAAAGDCTLVSWTNTAQIWDGVDNSAAKNGCSFSTITPTCYYLEGAATYCYYSCPACSNGYTGYLTNVSVLTSSCKNITVQAYNCKCQCSNCADTAAWVTKSTGYEQRTKKTCSCSTGSAVCTTSTVYRCATGYYGTTTNGTSGCSLCPTPGTSVAGANSSMSSCYIPEGTYSDTTGKYAFNCNCAYNGTDKCDSGSSSSSSAA